MADEKEEAPESPDVYFEPLVNLPPVETKTLEENEEILIKLRAKLFRYDAIADPPEWKERGVGDVKIMRNNVNHTCRVLMRRDKTLKICANHYVLPHMELKPNCGSDRAWVWNTPSDYADEEAKSELLAIRFANAENAQKFKERFNDAKKFMLETQRSEPTEEKINGVQETTKDEDASADNVAEQLKDMTVKDSKKVDNDDTETSGEKDSDQPDGSHKDKIER